MKIISKFHDYYDSALKQGIDKETIYKRESLVQVLKITDRMPFHEGWRTYQTDIEASFMYLGFCGEIYPVLRVSPRTARDKNGNVDNLTLALNAQYFYSAEDYKAFALDPKSGIFVDWDNKKKSFRSWFDARHKNGAEVRNFFSTKEESLKKYFTEFNTPVFLYHKPYGREVQITTNPVLKDLAFYKVKDPFSCFQEIYMFVSGVLRGSEKEMIQLSDKDKISKHGFDKGSFRKPKEQ